MAFVASSSHLFHDSADPYADPIAHSPHHHYPSHHIADHTQPGYYHPNVHMSCDIKPRLTKEQHDILEAHYQKQSKPNTNTKKGFAENLNVSLDKVNNWFQNRRAKAKQDAKKQAGAANNMYQQQSHQQQQQPGALNFSSDSDTSPSFASTDYFTMMQQFGQDDQLSSDGSMDHLQQYHEHHISSGLPDSSDTSDEQQYTHFAIPQQQQQQQQQQQLSVNMFESVQDMNRRTLTQEQFDAFAQSTGIMQSNGRFDGFQNDVSTENAAIKQAFPDMDHSDCKQQETFSFPVPTGAPLSGNDSSIPSTVSEQSTFPSSTTMQDISATSATSSEWADSRSSSVSFTPSSHDNPYQQASLPPQQSAATTSQWQPGQSIPVDPSQLQQQFREAAQRQTQPQQQATQQAHPLPWPADESFVRRESQTQALLAQQMSSFAIQTPQPSQSAAFQIPAPPGEGTSSIAARRQRPRPAALGLASLRSQSYSGSVQPASPNSQSQNLAAPGQQLRRIRSSNVINGVAQGRVMKSTPGSAQRSPLNWTFADAINSPKAVRHASSGSVGNLAPPTPLSPYESTASRQENSRPQFPPWQSSGHFNRQASISETEAEHDMPVMSTTSGQSVSSPPQTPMYHHHHYRAQFPSAHIGSAVITENTPPQSAPACQQSFPADVFVLPPQSHDHPSVQQAQGLMAAQQSQQFFNAPGPEQNYPLPVSFAPNFPFDSNSQNTMQFYQGVPIVNAQGHLTLGFPPQMQQMQFVPNMSTQQQQGEFMSPTGSTSGMSIPKQSGPAPEFYVHEYNPPKDMKRTATQRKVNPDSGPKNYTFANQGPEHFEKEKPKKGHESKSSTTASSSPASATSSS